jgi:hypothetical protein
VIVSASDDGTVRLWCGVNFALLQTLRGGGRGGEGVLRIQVTWCASLRLLYAASSPPVCIITVFVHRSGKVLPSNPWPLLDPFAGGAATMTSSERGP